MSHTLPEPIYRVLTSNILGERTPDRDQEFFSAHQLRQAVEDEREACAKVCEDVGQRRVESRHKYITRHCATAIRARGAA